MAITKMPGKDEYLYLWTTPLHPSKQGTEARSGTHYVTDTASSRGLVEQEKILRGKKITFQFCCIWVYLRSSGFCFKGNARGQCRRNLHPAAQLGLLPSLHTAPTDSFSWGLGTFKRKFQISLLKDNFYCFQIVHLIFIFLQY